MQPAGRSPYSNTSERMGDLPLPADMGLLPGSSTGQQQHQPFTGPSLDPEFSHSSLGLMDLASEPSFAAAADTDRLPHEWYGKLAGSSSPAAAPAPAPAPISGPWYGRPSLMAPVPQRSLLHGLDQGYPGGKPGDSQSLQQRAAAAGLVC